MPADLDAAKGSWGTVVWAMDANGVTPARDFIQSKDMTAPEKKKAWALLRHLAEVGHHLSFQADKFKKLGDKAPGSAKNLWELRPSDQIRFLGDFRDNRRFVVGIGTRKKQDGLRADDMLRAVRVLAEDKARATPGGGS